MVEQFLQGLVLGEVIHSDHGVLLPVHSLSKWQCSEPVMYVIQKLELTGPSGKQLL